MLHNRRMRRLDRRLHIHGRGERGNMPIGRGSRVYTLRFAFFDENRPTRARIRQPSRQRGSVLLRRVRRDVCRQRQTNRPHT